MIRIEDEWRQKRKLAPSLDRIAIVLDIRRGGGGVSICFTVIILHIQILSYECITVAKVVMFYPGSKRGPNLM